MAGDRWMKQRVLVVAMALALQACNKPSEAQLIASARESLAQEKVATAVLQLKSALQQDPDLPEARHLLGLALMRNGEYAAAAIELAKALEQGRPEVEVLPDLALAQLQSGAFQKVVERYQGRSLPEPMADASLKTSLAAAHERLGRTQMAERLVDEALQAAPGMARALHLRARLLAARGEVEAAVAALEQAGQAADAGYEVWLYKAALQQNELQDPLAALASFRQAVAKRLDLAVAHRGIIEILLARGEHAAAAAHVAEVKAKLPKQAFTHVLEALVQFARKDFQAARATLKPLLTAAAGTDPILLELAGATEYRLENLAAAQPLLEQSLALAPQSAMARHTLAQLYLRLGRADSVLTLLGPELERKETRPEVLALAAQAELLRGQPERAQHLYQRALRQSPGDSRLQAGLSLSQLGRAEGDAAVDRLETLAKGPEMAVTAKLGLVAAHLSQGHLDKAQKAVAELELALPNQPLTAQLRGRIQLALGNPTAARASFERALALTPGYLPALAALAQLDIGDGKVEHARMRYEALLQRDPGNIALMYALADVLAYSGAAPQLVSAQYRAAIKAAPAMAEPRLRLINNHLDNKDLKSALAAAAEAVEVLPSEPEILHAQGRVQLAAGESRKALSSFEALALQQPRLPAVQLGLANAHIALGDTASAERHLRRALEMSPKLLVAQSALIGLLVKQGKVPAALTVARQVQQQRPMDAVGFHFEGEIEQQYGSKEQALTLFRKAMQVSQSPEAAVKLHQALLNHGRDAEAQGLVQARLAFRPVDAAFRAYLGDLALARRDWAQAERWYRELVALQPGNAVALNNAASMLLKQGKTGALALAQRAIALRPNDGAIQDTLALALAAERQLERALSLQTELVRRQPEVPSYRLHLARMYLQAGNKERAREELQKLKQVGQNFAETAEVDVLLARL